MLRYDAFGRRIVAEYDGLLDAATATGLSSEFIYRAIVTGTRYGGHIWKSPDKLPEPVYTPTTKAELGLHDEHITFEESADLLEKLYPGEGLRYATVIRDATLALYRKCAEYALDKGIIIADTKFEFGLDKEGRVVLADEMLTPDSSRFWPKDGYVPGQGQPSFDKQYVRDWLKEHPDSDYRLPQDVIDRTIDKYKEAFLLLTGQSFAA